MFAIIIIVVAFVLLWDQNSRKTNETKQWETAALPTPPSPSPASRPGEHIFWALRAKHLLWFFKSKLLVSQGQLWEPGGVLLQICGGAAGSRCLFPLPKGFSMWGTEQNVNGENIQNQHAAQCSQYELCVCLFLYQTLPTLKEQQLCGCGWLFL